MPHADHNVGIDRPVAEVYRYVADGTTAPTWRKSCVDIRLAAGTAGQVGARYEQGLRGPRGRIPGDYEITEAIPERAPTCPADRRSTRLNSSHVAISYAVFCLKKKINNV